MAIEHGYLQHISALEAEIEFDDSWPHSCDLLSAEMHTSAVKGTMHLIFKGSTVPGFESGITVR